jgi:hypothetical protein
LPLQPAIAAEGAALRRHKFDAGGDGVFKAHRLEQVQCGMVYFQQVRLLERLVLATLHARPDRSLGHRNGL